MKVDSSRSLIQTPSKKAEEFSSLEEEQLKKITSFIKLLALKQTN